MDAERPNPFRRNRPISASKNPQHDLFIPEPGRIRVATIKDLSFIDSMQRKFADAIGFLPKLALEVTAEHGHIRIGKENDDNAGYILSRPHLKWQPLMRSITQTCVAMDAQKRHLGLAMLKQIEHEALADGLVAIQACCAVGLESNSFWKAAGFVPIVHMTPNTKSQREIICWRKLIAGQPPIWFAMPPARSGTTSHAGQSYRDIHRIAEKGDAAGAFVTTDHG